MAMKRCPDCGEKYSDSYKYCPFCEEEEILKEGKGRGVRRAKQSRSFSLLTPVLIVLILVMAGLLMFLLRSDKQPTEPVTPQPGVETPVEPGTDTEPGSTDSDGTDSTDPGTMPDEPDSNTPSTPTTPDTSSDTSAAGSEATIVNAATGVNVRPDASTNGAAIASLKNGDQVQLLYGEDLINHMIQDDYTFEEEEEKEFIEECKTIVAVPDAVEHQLEVAEKYGSNCIVLEKSYDDQKKMQEAGYTYYGQTDDYTVYFRE